MLGGVVADKYSMYLWSIVAGMGVLCGVYSPQ